MEIKEVLEQQRKEIEIVKSQEMSLRKPEGFDSWIEGREYQLEQIEYWLNN